MTRRHSYPRLTLTELETRETPASNFLAFGSSPGGTPVVEVLRPDGTTLALFEAFETGFRGGVRAVAAELDGDPNTVEIITAAGPGGAPHVKVWSVDVATGAVAERASFFAFETSFRNGVRVAAGQIAGPGDREQIIVGAEVGGGPRVRVLQLTDGGVTPIAGPLGDFFAFEPNFRGGVRVAAGELDGNPLNGDELVAAAGPGGGPRVRTFTSNGVLVSDAFVFDPAFGGGVNVGVETSGVGGRLRTDIDALDFSQRRVTLNQFAAGAALQAAVPAGANAVFATLFANPTFNTAFNRGGLAGTTFFNNGVFSTQAFLNPVNSGLFDTAFATAFGTTALANPAFSGAFNAVRGPQVATLPSGTFGSTAPFGTVGAVTVGGANTAPFTTGIASSVPVGGFAGTSAFNFGATPFVFTSTPVTAPVTFTSVNGPGAPFAATTLTAGLTGTTPVFGTF